MYGNKAALAQYQKINTESAVNGADPHRLIQLLMAGGLERLAQARYALEQNDLAAKGERLGKALSIIGGLQAALDREQAPELCDNLDNLYGYMQRRLLQANIDNDAAGIEEVRDLLQTIKSGWDELTPAAAG
ncbi:MAG: flagellar export chaperone FliS [Pseudomonadota bacterium]